VCVCGPGLSPHVCVPAEKRGGFDRRKQIVYVELREDTEDMRHVLL